MAADGAQAGVSPAVPRSTVIAVVAATTSAQVASIMASAIFPVIAVKLAAELEVPAAMIGYQVSIIYGTAFLTTAVMSTLIARQGACRMLQTGLAVGAVAMLVALQASIGALVVASILIGVGMSVMTPASAHLLYRFSPARNRNLVFSIKQTGVPLGWLVLALTAPGITLAFGWRWALVLALAVALVVIAAMQPMRARWDDDRTRQAAARQPLLAGLRLIWQRPLLRWLSLASLCFACVQLCLSSFLVIMLVEEVGLTLVRAGLLLSVVQVAGVVGRIGWGWLADRARDGVSILLALNVVMAACCLLCAFMTPDWPLIGLVLLFIAFGASAVGWNGVFLAEVAHRSPGGSVGIAIGGAVMWSYAGILAGPALFAFLCTRIGGYRETFGWLTVIALAGLACVLTARRAGRP